MRKTALTAAASRTSRRVTGSCGWRAGLLWSIGPVCGAPASSASDPCMTLRAVNRRRTCGDGVRRPTGCTRRGPAAAGCASRTSAGRPAALHVSPAAPVVPQLIAHRSGAGQTAMPRTPTSNRTPTMRRIQARGFTTVPSRSSFCGSSCGVSRDPDGTAERPRMPHIPSGVRAVAPATDFAEARPPRWGAGRPLNWLRDGRGRARRRRQLRSPLISPDCRT